MEKNKILVINPGSTSTKIALYECRSQLWQENIEHDSEALRGYATIYAQRAFRLQLVKEVFEAKGGRWEELGCVVARGGLLPPLSSGAYEVSDEMLDVLENRPMNHHASNLGAAIALDIARPLGLKAFIYDCVTVDEMIDVVRVTGFPQVRRHGQGHNLNMRAAALRYCEETGADYQDKSVIVAHLGGGITLTLHRYGQIVDMISDDEGPFSPERAGLIPGFKLTKIICGEGLDYKQAMFCQQRKGGLSAHLGTTDAREVEKRIAAGDEKAELVYDAMALGVAQSIGRLSVVACGKVDAIILTGGIAYSKDFTQRIAHRVEFIAPVTVIPGENEMQALADGAYRVLMGVESAKEYHEPSERPF